MKLKITTFIILSIIGIYSGNAQEPEEPEEMVTDRPDQTEAPSLVSKGFLQVETGFFYKDEEENGLNEKTTGYNTSLLRYGLLDNLELRFGFDLIKMREEMNGSEIAEYSTGFEPLLLGAKIGVAEEKGSFPEIGFIGHLYLPFAAAQDYRPESIGVDFRFAFSHGFSNSDLSYNLGAEWRDDNPEANFIYSIAYGFDITENFGAFAELYGDLPEDRSAAHHWDAGFTYMFQHNIQLDAFVGKGINNDQKLLAGGGISFRLPN